VNYVVSRPDDPTSPTLSVVVWDLQAGRIRQRLAGRAWGATSLAFHPNSRWLAAGNQDSTLKVWDTVAGNELHTLRGHTTAIDAVAFSPNGNLASVSIDGVLKLWDPATGSELQALPLGGPIRSATFSPDGSLLATRSSDPADTTIKLWDAADGRQLRAIPAGAGSAMAFSPDRLLLSQADENAHAIRLFEVATGRDVSRLDFNEPVIPQPSGHPEPNQVGSLAFSPNGRWLAGSVANVLHVHVWEVNSGREALHLPAARGVAFSPDSQWLATTAGALFHIATPRELPGGRSELTLFSGNTGNVSKLAFLGDGHTLASVSGGDVRLWDASTGQTIETVLNVGDGTRARKLAFSPDGHWLATAEPFARDSPVRVWDLKSTKEPRSLTISTQGKRWPGIVSLAFSPDGHLLAAGGFNEIMLADVDTGRELRTLVTGEDPTEDVQGWGLIRYCVMNLAFSRDGRHLVAVGRSVQVWDSITGQRLADLPAPGAVLSPDGRWLAALRDARGHVFEKQLVLYDAATLHEVRSLFDFPPDATLLSFSADGRELATIEIQPPEIQLQGGSATVLKVRDTSTGQILRTLPLYHELVGATALSNDWRWLAAVPQQGEVAQMQTSVDIWEVSTGRRVHTLTGLPVRVLSNRQPPLHAQGNAPDYPDVVDMMMSGIRARSANGLSPQEIFNARVRDAAILKYQQALDLTPNDPDLHFALGAQFEARGAAAATSSAARPPGPDLPEAARKDYESALEQYRQAHQLARDSPGYQEAFERLSRLLKRP
jgi:WD40 repeat protein